MADSNPIENWRAVVGHESRYEVSDLGRLRSKPSVDSLGRRHPGGVLKGTTFRGYVEYCLYGGSAGKSRARGHNLVLCAFVGPRPAGMEACHRNGDGADNRLINLRWDTHSANMADMRIHGRSTKGERSVQAKLNWQAVAEMRAQSASGASDATLGKRFGVDVSHVNRIVAGKRWREG